MSGTSDNLKNQLEQLEIDTFNALINDPEIARLHTVLLLGELTEVSSPYTYALVNLRVLTSIDSRARLEAHIKSVVNDNKDNNDFLPLRNYLAIVEKNRIFTANLKPETADADLIGLLESSFGDDLALVKNVPSIEVLFATAKREAIPLTANEMLANDIHNHLTSRPSSDALNYYVDNHADKSLVSATEAVKAELHELFQESIVSAENLIASKPQTTNVVEIEKQEKLKQFDVDKFFADLKAEKEKQGVLDILNKATKSINELLDEAAQSTGKFIKENGKKIGGFGTIGAGAGIGLAVGGPIGLGVGAGVGALVFAVGAGIDYARDKINESNEMEAQQKAKLPIENAVVETSDLTLHALTTFFNKTLANRLPNPNDFALLEETKNAHKRVASKLASVKKTIEEKKQVQLSVEAAQQYKVEKRVFFKQSFGINEEQFANELSSLKQLGIQAEKINQDISQANREFNADAFSFTAYEKIEENADYNKLRTEKFNLLKKTADLRSKLLKLNNLMALLPDNDVVNTIQNDKATLAQNNFDRLVQLLRDSAFKNEVAELRELEEDIHALAANPIAKTNTEVLELSKVKILCDNAFVGKSEETITKHLNNYQRVVGNLNALSKRIQQESTNLEKAPLLMSIQSLIIDTTALAQKSTEGFGFVASEILTHSEYAASQVSEIDVTKANNLRTTMSALKKSLEAEVTVQENAYKIYNGKVQTAEDIFKAAINSERFKNLISKDYIEYLTHNYLCKSSFYDRFQKESLNEIMDKKFNLNDSKQMHQATTRVIDAFVRNFSLASIYDECHVYSLHLAFESTKTSETVNAKSINVDEFRKTLVMKGNNITQINLSHKLAYNDEMARMIMGEKAQSQNSVDILKSVTAFSKRDDVSFVYSANRDNAGIRLLKTIGKILTFGLYKGEAVGHGVKRRISDGSDMEALQSRKRFKSGLFSAPAPKVPMTVVPVVPLPEQQEEYPSAVALGKRKR